jgi:hypothetical protein
MHKKLSVTLGFMIFTFGFLKFFEPFRTWYVIQIQTSGLSEASYFAGIFGEMVVGLILMSSLFLKNEKFKYDLSIIGSLGLIGIMSVAIYVHLLPEVPAEVLPMNIKPPVIPILFLLATMYNIYLALKLRKSFK